MRLGRGQAGPLGDPPPARHPPLRKAAPLELDPIEFTTPRGLLVTIASWKTDEVRAGATGAARGAQAVIEQRREAAQEMGRRNPLTNI